MSSQVPPSSTPNPQSPVKAKASNRSLVILAVLLAGAGIAAFAVPEVLKQIYLAEEEAKRKQGPIVGSRTDVDPPPGVSRDPYASMPGRNAGNQEKPAEDKAPEEKPAGEEYVESESENKSENTSK
jgi:predicted lipid-binding transport protein (Tim44 family)